jgi:hypothetical protein
VLQVAELAVAFVFVDVAVHLASQGLLLGAAAVLAVLALTARGPLGIVRLFPRRLHAATVVVVSVAIALSPILPVLRPDLVGILVAEFAAIGLIRLATLTRTADVATAPAAPREPETASPVSASAGDEAGAPPGRSDADLSAVEKSARTAAAAAVAGREVVERYRPAAEDQARRALRGAGRSVGRVLRRVSPPADPPS